jgi:hypothetical protein
MISTVIKAAWKQSITLISKSDNVDINYIEIQDHLSFVGALKKIQSNDILHGGGHPAGGGTVMLSPTSALQAS